MEHRRLSQTMASEWQTAFVVSHKMPWCALLTAVKIKNYNKSLEKLQDFFFKTKTKCSRPRPRLHDPRPRLSFFSSRRLETKTLVSRTTSLAISRAKLWSNHHHQQTNTKFFTGRMPFLSPNQQCQSTEGRYNIYAILK